MPTIIPYKYRPKANCFFHHHSLLYNLSETLKPKSHFFLESKPKSILSNIQNSHTPFPFVESKDQESSLVLFETNPSHHLNILSPYLISKMSSQGNKIHVFFLPFLAYGHMIPMVDIARQVAARGAKSTIITTVLNASVLTKITERDRNSGLNINILAIRFQAEEAGLPTGIENADSVDSKELVPKFFVAINLLQEPFKQLLEEHRPDLIVADMFLPWTTDIGGALGIPRLVFHGTNCFSQCVSDGLRVHEPYKNISAEAESFIVPGLPDQIEIKRSQLPEHIGSNNLFSQMMDKCRDSEVRSYGVLVNSFYDLEPAYADHYRKVMGRKTWHIGPVSLRNRETTDKAYRGKKATVDEHYVLNWLDSKNPKSVLYICFGSITRFSSGQLKEIAMGLENSGVSFVWVIRKTKKAEVEQETFLPEGFEERIEGKGLIIRDWAPQVLILDHQAIGGFMTHCGWNSILEGISAGVPMITWPLFAEQFYNENFVTQILKIGIRIGVEKFTEVWSDEKEYVTQEIVEQAVNQLMGDGEEAKEMRRKAIEFKEMAKRAVEESGSSYKDLTALIEEIRMHRQTSSTQTENQMKLDAVSE